MEYSPAVLRESLLNLDLPPESARDLVDERVLMELDTRFGDAGLERLSAALEGDLFDGNVFDYRDLITASMLATYSALGEIARGNVQVERLDFGRRRIRLPVARIDWWVMRRATVGLLEPGVDADGRRFGVTVDLPNYFPPIHPATGTLFFPRLRRSLPLLITRAQVELHESLHPANATRSCFGVRNGAVGVVTAGHAVEGLASEEAVPLDAGRTGILLHSGYRPIDAAFIGISEPTPALAPLPTLRFVTAGDELMVCTRRSAVRRTVVDAGLTQLDPRFRDYPLNFLMDEPLQPGDSGSLVTLLSREAVGIYVGAQWRLLPSGRSGDGTSERTPAGLVQNFAQAMYALRVRPLAEMT